MSLYWLEPSWTEAVCSCGAKIWPEGDPDWGACVTCFTAQQQQAEQDADAEALYYAQLEAEYNAKAMLSAIDEKEVG